MEMVVIMAEVTATRIQIKIKEAQIGGIILKLSFSTRHFHVMCLLSKKKNIKGFKN